MKISKCAKASEHEDVVDIISSLPDDVLQLILSRIPKTEELNRTSILSKRWRFLWTSVPSINIDCTRGLEPVKDWNRFKDFVDWVLLNKPLNLDSFCLWCGLHNNMSTISEWIHVAVMKKVKLLDLMFAPTGESGEIEVPHCLVTYDSLEVLKLCLLKRALCLPNITGFAALRVLKLMDVVLDESELVKYFLESCPMLEDLSLIDCIVDKYQIICISSLKLKNLRIENYEDETGDDRTARKCLMIDIVCPKLVFLKLTGDIASNFWFNNLYSLKEAVIDVVPDFSRPMFWFFNKISRVEYLSISHHCIGMCFLGFEQRSPRKDLPLKNLKTLEIIVDCYSISSLIIPFLKLVPDLESLHLIVPQVACKLEYWKLHDAETIMRVLTRLKRVKFEFIEEEPKLDLARALLEHGTALEEMVFIWGNEAWFHEKSVETMNQMSNSHKASSSVKLSCVFERLEY